MSHVSTEALYCMHTVFFISASSHFESSIELPRLLRQDVASALICLLLKQTDAVTRLKEPGHFVAFIKITPALIPCIFSSKWKILNCKANFLSHIHWISFRFHFFYPLNCCQVLAGVLEYIISASHQIVTLPHPPTPQQFGFAAVMQIICFSLWSKCSVLGYRWWRCRGPGTVLDAAICLRNGIHCLHVGLANERSKFTAPLPFTHSPSIFPSFSLFAYD